MRILKACVLFLFIFLTAQIQCECFELIEEDYSNNFVLLVDKSGSMQNSIDDLKMGVEHFINKMKNNDKGLIVSFSSSIEIHETFSSNTSTLVRSLRSIETGGNTRLYDAIVRATSELQKQDGNKIIVYFTDGYDTGSLLSLSEIEKINVSEGIYIYGIGMGDVNVQGLTRLSKITNGEFVISNDSSDLKDIYTNIIMSYNKKYQNMKETCKVTVLSIPDRKRVTINGVDYGETPLNLDSFQTGKNNVAVQFANGKAGCSFLTKLGYRTIITLRETDIGKDLIVTSNLPGSYVFIDSVYVGITSYKVLRGVTIQKMFIDKDQLCIKDLSVGNHKLEIIGIPEIEWGSDQKREFNIEIMEDGPGELCIYVPILKRKDNIVTNIANVNEIKTSNDPFDELDKEVFEKTGVKNE
ncbi:MAG: VWA domain-containing protein [Candidatus Stygibacter australis]|nr:VWA domain-containing protein [Candidatus Stygibacter australis]